MGRLQKSRNPEPAVLVIGHFPAAGSSGGFAVGAWQKIDDNYKQRCQERKHRTSNGHKRTSAGQPIKLLSEAEPLSGSEPLLCPIKLDDEGDAGSLKFRHELYDKFKSYNVWGVISCCTAENSSKLLEALEPIDTPILIALDNTVERAVMAKPNLLQLIPNNALQAQAILSKVGDSIPEGESDANVKVNVYLSPRHNDFVRDLWDAMQNKANEAQNSRISLIPNTLKDAGGKSTKQEVVVYIGYYEGLERLLDLVKAKRLILSDACYESRVETRMREKKRAYYLARPSFDPSDYAYYGYLSLSRIWLESSRGEGDFPLDQRLQPVVARLRSDMEKRFDLFRFVGTTNQRGGYILLKREPAEEE